MARVKKVTQNTSSNSSFFEKIQQDLSLNQSSLSFVLGILILVVLGLLVFNYFNKSQGTVGPSQQTNQTQPAPDVTKENLPGKYSVKEGDTLFSIAEKYYGDGHFYPKIVEENKLPDENLITTDQILTIPKVDTSSSQNLPPSPDNNQYLGNSTKLVEGGTGGAINQTIWGERINSDSYTVQSGDWLSKIAGRAYGDIFAFDKIAKANNISNPDKIEIGMVLKIPR